MKINLSSYLLIAADRGHAGALNNLGVCYEDGDGVETDLNEALRLYLLAAKEEDLNGLLNVSKCYRLGKGTAIDLE